MNNEKLEKLLSVYNPWWTAGDTDLSVLPQFRRPVFDKLSKAIDGRNQIIILYGTYGTGKTTILRQLIDDKLASGISPTNVVYLCAADPAFWGVGNRDILLSIIKQYSDDTDKSYIFIDEIQAIPGWEDYIADIIKQHPKLTIVAATSSTRPDIAGRGGLLGRIKPVKINPFSFAEYFYYHYAKKEGLQKTETLKLGYQEFKIDFLRLFDKHISKRIETGPVFSFIEESVDNFLRVIDKNVPFKLEWHNESAKELLPKYIADSGFPVLWNIHDNISRREIIANEFIDRPIRGLGLTEKSKNAELLKRLLYALYLNANEPTSIKKLATTLGCSNADIKANLALLKKYGLIDTCYKFGNRDSKVTTAFIPYPSDQVLYSGLATSDMRQIATSLQQTIVYNLLKSRSDVLAMKHNRDGRGMDVDFVALLESGDKLPVSLDTGTGSVTQKELQKYISKFECDYGILVTDSGPAEFGKRILRVPFHLFLLLFESN